MKTTIIDNQNFFKNTKYFRFSDCITGTPLKVSDDIMLRHSDSDLFLINVNYKCEKDRISRAENPGIEVLKRIRLNGLSQHCIIYSFLSREQLMKQSTNNLIIYSHGITYIHLPEIVSESLITSCINDKCKVDLTSIFKTEFDIIENRHDYANWWGLYRLWEVHKHINYERYKYLNNKHINDYPEELIEWSKILQSQIAIFLFGFNADDATKDIEINENKQVALKKRIYAAGQRLDLLEKDLRMIESGIEKSNLRSDHKSFEEGIEEAFKNLFLTKSQYLSDEELRNYIIRLRRLNYNLDNISIIPENRVLSVQKDIIEKYKEMRLSLYKNITELSLEIESVYEQKFQDNEKVLIEAGFGTLKYRISELRNILQSRSDKIRILYIDDQAAKGWSKIFQLMIFDYVNEKSFKTIVPDKQNIEGEIINIKSIIYEFNPTIILLDFRLLGETGIIYNVNNISGTMVLQEIKNEFNNIPVIMTTASNKAHSLVELTRLGADDYWIKEGIDSGMSSAESVYNYAAFLSIIEKFSR